MRSLISTLLLFLSVVAQARELPGVPNPIPPIPGPLILCGEGEISPLVVSVFAALAEGEKGRIVILTSDAKKASTYRDLWQTKVSGINVIELKTREQANSADFLAPISDATGVWVDGDFSKIATGTLLEKKLRALTNRNWVIGGSGSAAESFGELIIDGDVSRKGFAFLPSSVVRATKGSEKKRAPSEKLTNLVTWEIPPAGIMVVHEGRRVGVIGTKKITARVAAYKGWPERSQSFSPPPVELPYSTNIFSWTRSAKARSTPVFPSKKPPIPSVDSGTLILIGGGGSIIDMWERFVKEAGGKDANFVCIIQSPQSSIPRKLRNMGCSKVTVLNSNLALRPKADSDEMFLKALKEANGIFFGGGRTYRFMDVYQQTKAHRLMFETLERGGVIAGTSAGAQIQGDFLVRGDPRTNQTLWYPGNDTGLGFLRGVIIDVHFGERKRERTLPKLLARHRGMQGIGIDEATAIVIKGTTAEVLGRGSAWFYDNGNTRELEREGPIILKAGKSYDLKLGKTIR